MSRLTQMHAKYLYIRSSARSSSSCVLEYPCTGIKYSVFQYKIVYCTLQTRYLRLSSQERAVYSNKSPGRAPTEVTKAWSRTETVSSPGRNSYQCKKWLT